MPQADQSFGQISDLLGNIMTGSSQTPTATAALVSSSIKLDEKAMDILQEATSLVEENTRDKLPDLPLSKNRVVSDTNSKLPGCLREEKLWMKKRMAQVIDGRTMSVGEILDGAAQDSEVA